jgi:mitochondrial fission protein ELM1
MNDGESAKFARPSETMGEAGAEPPLVWLLLGERQGDNAQVRALGLALSQSLGWRTVEKQLTFDEACTVLYSKRGASLIGLDQARSAKLKAPWPDAVFAMGRATASVSQWIKKQSDGRALSVHLGRVRDAIERFDLILTTPQYTLPPSANVLEVALPLTYADEAALVAEAAAWEPKLRHLPRPWTALVIGGPTTQMKFDAEVGEDIIEKTLAHAGGKGSLLITTSPRTSTDVCDLLGHRIPMPNYVFRWAQGAANPYRAFLNLADSFIVTSDSPAMIAELIDRRKPVYLYEIPFREDADSVGLAQMMRQYYRSRRLHRLRANAREDLIDTIYDQLVRLGKARPLRNFGDFNQNLYRLGVVRALGAGPASAVPLGPHITAEERNQVVARIDKIFEAKRRG